MPPSGGGRAVKDVGQPRQGPVTRDVECAAFVSATLLVRDARARRPSVAPLHDTRAPCDASAPHVCRYCAVTVSDGACNPPDRWLHAVANGTGVLVHSHSARYGAVACHANVHFTHACDGLVDFLNKCVQFFFVASSRSLVTLLNG